MMQQNDMEFKAPVRLNDLTIFDYPISSEDKRAMECPKILYIISICLNFCINIFMLIGMMSQTFEVTTFFGLIISFACYVFSIAYVMYPKSQLARSFITRVMLILFGIATGIFVFVAIIIALILGIFQESVDGNSEFEGVWRFFYFYILILALIPVFHCTIIIVIWRQRKRIAWKMEDIMNRNVNQNDQAYPPYPNQYGQPYPGNYGQVYPNQYEQPNRQNMGPYNQAAQPLLPYPAQPENQNYGQPMGGQQNMNPNAQLQYDNRTISSR